MTFFSSVNGYSQVIFALMVVLGLLFFIYLLWQHWRREHGFRRGHTSQKRVEIISLQPLDMKRQLTLIRFDDDELLVLTSDQSNLLLASKPVKKKEAPDLALRRTTEKADSDQPREVGKEQPHSSWSGLKSRMGLTKPLAREEIEESPRPSAQGMQKEASTDPALSLRSPLRESATDDKALSVPIGRPLREPSLSRTEPLSGLSRREALSPRPPDENSLPDKRPPTLDLSIKGDPLSEQTDKDRLRDKSE